MRAVLPIVCERRRSAPPYLGQQQASLDAEKSVQPVVGLYAAGFAPSHELGDIDPAIARLGVVDPGLGLAELDSDVALGHPGLFARGTKQLGHRFVVAGVLSL